MTSRPEDFGQQVVALELVSSAARDRYERQLRTILEERLSAFARGCCLAAGLICLLFGIAAALVVFLDREAYGYWPNLVLGIVVTATALAIGLALIGVAVRGVYRRQQEGRWAAQAGLVLLATWGLFMLLAAGGLPDALRDMFLTLGLVCLGAAAFVAHRLSAAHRQLLLEKRLLELERELAEISERLNR